jgi:hypothetical protein
MTVLELEAREVSIVKIANVNVVVLPVEDWKQTEPHLHIAYYVGTERDGVFIPVYLKERRFQGADMAAFLAQFGTLESAFLAFLVSTGEIRGTVRE